VRPQPAGPSPLEQGVPTIAPAGRRSHRALDALTLVHRLASVLRKGDDS
jgi:hypothetical protein